MKKAIKWVMSHLLQIGGLYVLFYWGYCWGWWGRDIKLLAFLFQCSCPPISEEFRYPEYFDVIVPACGNLRIDDISPSKRYFAISEEGIGGQGYIYDLATRSNRKTELTPNGALFLNDDVFVNYYDEPPRLINLETQKISNVFNIERLPGILNNHSQPVDLAYDVWLFSKAERIYFFYMGDSYFLLGVKSRIFGENIAFGKKFNSKNPEKVIHELKIQGIPFKIMNTKYYGNLPERNEADKKVYSDSKKFYSLDGNFFSRNNAVGIYLSKDDKLFTPEIGNWLKTTFGDYGSNDKWINQDEGIIFGSSPVYLIGDGSGGFDVWPTSFFPIPQPVLLLKVPDEYQTPENQALHATQRQNEMMAGILAVFLPLGVTGFGFWKLNRQRKKGQLH